jgi:hypothetical protein
LDTHVLHRWSAESRQLSQKATPTLAGAEELTVSVLHISLRPNAARTLVEDGLSTGAWSPADHDLLDQTRQILALRA